MLTACDPRHRKNLDKGDKAQRSLRVLNIFDPADLLNAALASSSGEQVILNWLGNNSAAFKAVARTAMIRQVM